MSLILSASRRTLVAVVVMALLLAVALLSAGPAAHVLGAQSWNKQPKAGAAQSWNKPSRVLGAQSWNKLGAQSWN